MASITLTNISDLAGLYPSRGKRFNKKERKLAEAVAAAGVFTSPLIKTALHLNDATTAAYDVKLIANGNGGTPLTADHSLTLDLYNADRTIDLQGNISLAGSLTTAGALVTSGAYSLTLTTTNTTVATLPAGTVTLVDLSSSQTLSSKVLTAPDVNGGTADSLTSLSLRDTSAAYDVTVAVTSNPILTAGRILTLNMQNAARSVSLAGNISLGGTLTTAAALTQAGAFATTITSTAETNATLPEGTVTLVDLASAQVLSSKTLTAPQINDTSADHQYVFVPSELTDDRNVTLPLLTGADEFVFKDHAVTMANKTLTSPVLNTGVSGTAVLDEDTMASNSATQLATQQSIKAYVDALYVGYDDALTVDDDGNVAGLASAIALANEVQIDFDAHCADAGEHTTSVDAVNVTTEPAASDITTLIALTTELLTGYDAHEGDAELGAAWVFHGAQEAGDHSLASTAAPTTLAECITRLNDIKTKLNAHDADGTAHGTDTQHQVTADDSAMGAAVAVAVAGAVSGNKVVWGILDSGTGTVTGVSAVAGTAKVTFTFSADPQADTIISYMVLR